MSNLVLQPGLGYIVSPISSLWF